MIPSIAHFIWLGPSFPWLNVLAIRSAAMRGGFERVVLHHDRDLSKTRWWPQLEALDRFEARPLELDGLFHRASASHGDQLYALFRKLDPPASRANMIRAAILAAEGGCYLDIDTITLRELDPLRATCGVFCGTEHICWPGTVKYGRSVTAKGRALALGALRELFRFAPGGWRHFHRVEGLYTPAVNNAVLACAPGHPFITGMLEHMLAMPEEHQLRRFALGTHLLQRRVVEYRGEDLVVHPPPVFYPLGPVISLHYFRHTRDAPRLLDQLLDAETRVIHWYASVHTKRLVPRFDPAYVRAHADRQLLSALALPFT